MALTSVNNADYQVIDSWLPSPGEVHRLTTSRYWKPSVEGFAVPTLFLLSRLSSLINLAVESSTSAADICRHLATETLAEHDCRYVLIRRIDENGLLRTVASFGVGVDVLTEWEGFPLAKDHQSSLAVESGELIWIDFENCTMITCPLDADHVLGIEFGSGPVATPDSRAIMGIVGSVVAANLRLHGGASRAGLGVLNVESVNLLTVRQLRILSLMSEGLSNFQIAQRIDYSDSTVRQETMRIYSILGFKDRREAIDWYRRALRLPG